MVNEYFNEIGDDSEYTSGNISSKKSRRHSNTINNNTEDVTMNTTDDDINVQDECNDDNDDDDDDNDDDEDYVNENQTPINSDCDDDDNCTNITDNYIDVNKDNRALDDEDDDDEQMATDDECITKKSTISVHENNNDIVNLRNNDKTKINKITNLKAKRTKIAKRRQTIDTFDLRRLVLNNNTNNDIRSKMLQSFNLSKNQIVIDYNILAFLENRDVESDDIMESRMIKFINNFKNNYKGIQHIEYKINNKLFCSLDIIYFLPILFNRHESQELIHLNSKSLDIILDRLNVLTEKILTSINSTHNSNADTIKNVGCNNARKLKTQQSMSSTTSPTKHDGGGGNVNNTNGNGSSVTIPVKSMATVASSVATKMDTTTASSSNVFERTVTPERNIRLYQIGGDFYLMCRKRQNFIDGQKNLEKKYGKCRLLKTWNNRNDVKNIGKLILNKFPSMKWNARTNILTNSKSKPISENDLLNYLIKIVK